VNRERTRCVRNQKGFTLIEVIAVLVILGVLATVAASRFVRIVEAADRRALEIGIADLNTEERVAWAKIKISETGWESDAQVFSEVDTDLGNDYFWSVGPTVDGGRLHSGDSAADLLRTYSTSTGAGFWQ